MQVLDSFIPPVPGFDGDIPIPAILVLARPPGNESTSDPSAGDGVSALKTRAGKRKASANLTPQKKPRKPWENLLAGSKLMNPCPSLLLRLLHQVLSGISRLNAEKGTLVMSIFP
jgi:hypothetical protein